MNFPRFRLRPRAFGIAVLCVAVALVLMGLLNPVSDMVVTPFLLFFGAVVMAAWWGEVEAALGATVLSALLAWYVFMSPQYSFALEISTVVRLVAFLVQGFAISAMVGSWRSTQRRLTSSNLELQASERSLNYTNQWIIAILESITEGFYALDLQWRFIYVNPQAQHLLERPLVDLLGQSIWEVLPELEGSTMGAALRQAMAGRQSTVVETQGVVHPDRLFEMHMNPMANGLAIYFRDLTHQKQAEAALRRSELHFRTLADSMPQMFWTASADGQLEYVNQRWYNYTGLTPDQSVAQGWLAVLHPEDRDRCQGAWAKALQTGEPLTLEARPRRANDGQYRWHLVRAFRLQDEGGEVLRWFGSSTDIHDQRMALAERDRALTQERVARAEAEAASRIKDEFLAILSHELRTPLNPILGWLTLMRSRPLDEATRSRALDTIERNARVQADLIEDLLDVSRILQGKLRLDIQTVNLGTVIGAALETVRLSAKAKAIALRSDCDPAVGPVSGDYSRLQQIVWNLLANAIKFTPEGGEVSVRLCQDNHYAVIEVRDNGQGISADFLPHVFESFRQADSSSSRTFGGLGLGLAIVRYLTEQHGGRVAVASPGEYQGATFTVRLPLARGAVALPPEPCDPPRLGNLAGRKALVIDDDLDSLYLLTISLQNYGIEVLTASSAQAGLDLVEQHHPDVVISDIGMPDRDGYMLVQALRQRPRAAGGGIPAIALTAYAGDQDRDRAIAAGFQRHLTKPLDLDQLGQTLAELIHRSAAETQAHPPVPTPKAIDETAHNSHLPRPAG